MERVHKHRYRVTRGTTQPSTSPPNVLTDDKLNLEDEEGEVYDSPGGESENSGANHGAVNKPGNHFKPAPAAQMYEDSHDKDDREEEDADDIARTINAGLSGNDPSETATKLPKIGMWTDSVGLGKGVDEILDLESSTEMRQAPESNTSRKRATDVSEQTFANNSVPNSEEEVPARSRLKVAPKQLKRPLHVFRHLNKSSTNSGKGLPNPYEEFDEISPIATTARASKATGQGGKKPLTPRPKSGPERTTSRNVMSVNREAPHKAPNKLDIISRDNEEDDDSQFRVSPQMEQSKRVEAVMSAATPAKRVTRSNKFEEIFAPNDFSRRPEKGGAHISTSSKTQATVGLGATGQTRSEMGRPRKIAVRKPNVEASSPSPVEASIAGEPNMYSMQRNFDSVCARSPPSPTDDDNHAEGGHYHLQLRDATDTGRVFPEDAADAFSGVPMNPSPTNITRLQIVARQADNFSSGKLVGSRSSRTREAPSSNVQNENMRNSQQNSEPEVIRDKDVTHARKILLDDNILKKMIELVGRVRKFNLSTKHTKVGQTMKHITMKITSTYRKIKEYENSEEPNRNAIDEQHDAVALILEELESKSSDIIATRLGDARGGGHNANPEHRLNILKDLYLHIFPGLVESLNAAVSAYLWQGQISTPNLEEVSRILKVMKNLLAAAADEKEKPSRKDYPGILRPMQSLFVIVPSLYKDCNNELEVRAAAIKAAAYERAAPERKRKREERELAEKRAEEEAYQDRLRRRRRDAGASWKRQMELGLIPNSSLRIGEPLLRQQSRAPGGTRVTGFHATIESQLSLAERRKAKDEEAARLESELHRVRQEARKLKRAEERLRQGFFGDGLRRDGDSMHGNGEDGDEERLHMFGENNTATSATSAWALVELETLVDGLREHRGRDRYEILATRLDRSYDEIFAKAREFRVTMEENLERKRQEHSLQHLTQLEDWIDCIGKEF